MKTKITLLLLFIGFVSKANFVPGTILFNDGHSETGFIKSFLEDKLLNNPLSSLEDNLNLNDKTLKFKTSENGDVRKIKIDDINEVTLLRGNNIKQEFKVLYLKEINRKGEFEDSKTKVCLPLVKKGKVNIYGFTYDHTSSDGKFSHRYRDVAFYYQNANENYAFNYYDFDIQDLLSFKQRFFIPLKELFKDCPDLVTFVNNSLLEQNLTKEEKAKAKEEYKKHVQMLKIEYKDVPAEVVNGNLDVFHKFKLNPMDELINRYNNECK